MKKYFDLMKELKISALSYVPIWTESGSQRRLNKLTSDLTQVEL